MNAARCQNNALRSIKLFGRRRSAALDADDAEWLAEACLGHALDWVAAVYVGVDWAAKYVCSRRAPKRSPGESGARASA